MRNTKENVVKLVEKLIEKSNEQARNERHEKAVQDIQRHTAIGMQQVLWLLTDKDYFNDIWEIWGDEIE